MKKLLLILVVNSIFQGMLCAQDVFILGRINDENIEQTIELCSEIMNLSNPRRIRVQFGSDFTVDILKRNESDDFEEVKSGFADLPETMLHDPNNDEWIKLKKYIGNKYGKKYQIVTLYKRKKANNVTNFHQFDDLLQEFENDTYRKKKFVVLLCFSNEYPSVEITSPKAGSPIYGRKITGTAKGDVSEVYVRINNGKWLKAAGKKEWSLELPINDDIHTIEAISVDVNGDSSVPDIINRVQIIIPTPLVASVTPIHPGLSVKSRMPETVLFGSNVSTIFKIKISNPVDLSSLFIIFKDGLGTEIERKNVLSLIPKFLVGSYQLDDVENSTVYCFRLDPLDITNKKFGCDIRQDEEFIMSFYYDNPETISLPDDFKIYFTPFDESPSTLPKGYECH